MIVEDVSIVRYLLLCFLLIAPAHAIAANVVTTGGGQTTTPADYCANAIDPSACYKANATGANSKEAVPGFDNQADLCANFPDSVRCNQSSSVITNQKKSLPGTDAASALPSHPGKQPKKIADSELNEFQEFVAISLGKALPMYGYALFNEAPDTFAPVENIPVTPDYLIGPGDEIIIRGWGKVDIDVKALVNRNGAIDLPKVGAINVAGVRYEALQAYLKTAIGRVLRNVELNVTLGKLRSIQIFVLGQARQPGVYTLSSLSSAVNALFASGGPSLKGSLRHIQIKRNGKVVSELDMYELLLNGDKTKDVALMSGDVIYIPPAGQLVAISGSVNNPAIYELKNDKTSLSELLAMAGGLTNLAEGEKVKVERIEERKNRKVEEFSLNASGLARILKDGDSVQVESIQGRFDNAVTLRGNISSPGRYPWKPGMRVSDLIPSKDFLIVRDYWAKQNQVFRQRSNEEGLHGELISHTGAEINWGYAVIERLKKDDLSTVLISFNLGQAVDAKDSDDNKLLEEGDTITIFSKDDIKVPASKQSVYVRLEGEVNSAGIYSVLPGETLRQLVRRIGGFTPNAYLFGAELDRESVRRMQQKRLYEMADRMEADIRRNLAAKQHSALSQEDANNAKLQAEAQSGLVAKLRSARATGRVVLEISPRNSGIDDLPDLVLEDGDRLIIPGKPSTVSVMGMVYNENEFIYQSGMRISDYLGKAGGPTRDADESRIYLLRADGSVLSAQSAGSFFNSFSNAGLMPGDSVVVPEMLDKFSFTKELKDWAQIFYQFALGVASIKILRM